MANVKLSKIIERKRNGEILTREDISYFVKSVVRTTKENQDIFETADRCQIGAMLMAIYLKGFNKCETAELTLQMRNFGEVFEWPNEWKDIIVDKHSTGGVGDKVSLILAPALAALGLKVPMISGRSLAHTGGTLDKLESIPGFRAQLNTDEIRNAMKTVGCCIVGQTDNCVPADKVLYKCRELTATAEFSPFIISSIASKKLSEGLNSLVYDVKFGKGSTFKTKEEALNTAKSLVESSKGINASAVFTSMDSPLGRSIGNSLEVLEAVECLKGKGPQDVLQIVCALGAELLHQTKKSTLVEGEKLILKTLKNGEALKKFYEMIICQGVTTDTGFELCYGDTSKIFTKAPHETNITYSGEEGYISGIDPLGLANIWKEENYFSHNNPGVGLVLLKNIGDKIYPGDKWLKVHHQREKLTNEQETKLASIITVSPERAERRLIDKRIFYKDDILVVDDY